MFPNKGIGVGPGTSYLKRNTVHFKKYNSDKIKAIVI